MNNEKMNFVDFKDKKFLELFQDLDFVTIGQLFTQVKNKKIELFFELQ